MQQQGFRCGRLSQSPSVPFIHNTPKKKKKKTAYVPAYVTVDALLWFGYAAGAEIVERTAGTEAADEGEAKLSVEVGAAQVKDCGESRAGAGMIGFLIAYAGRVSDR